MQKYLVITVLLAVVVGLSGFSGPAIAQEMDPAAVVEAVYTAVEAKDLETAGEYLAEDAVLVLIPPPPGTDGTFVGKEAVLSWYENLGMNNFAIEFSNVQVDGDRVTIKNLTWVDDLPVAPVEFDGTGIVQDGLIKTLSWVMTPESIAELDAAFERGANDALVERILLEIWSEGNLDLADELVAEDYASHTWPVGEGRDDFKADVASWRTDFPGATIVVDRIVWDGNRAIIFSHNAEPGGSVDKLPPEADIDDILVYQIENGQLSDRWYFAPFDPTQ
jgi:ketosteroid isomerase-like protein/predicted SnoaL-like aldol condensation-catalyzing enzyme